MVAHERFLSGGRMLTTKGKRILLSIHLLLNSVWIGGIIAIIFLNLLRTHAVDGDQVYAINMMIFRIQDDLVMNVSFGVILTGLLFSLFTQWGFVRFRWVAVKWIAVITLFVLITFYLAPSVNGMAAIADVDRTAAVTNSLYLQFEKESLMFLSLQLLLLVLIILVSVFKPWGQRTARIHLGRKTVLIMGGLLPLVLIIGLTVQYIQLESYRNLPIKNINLSEVTDGWYIGEADYGFRFVVLVDVRDHKIQDVRVIRNYDNVYAQLAEGVITKVLKNNDLNVTAVTGATTTSKCLMKAIEHAIEEGVPL
jgi:uncharacterized protein with FMN-binding domain